VRYSHVLSEMHTSERVTDGPRAAAAEGRFCPRCGRSFALWGLEVACTACGGPLEWHGAASDVTAGAGLWRYAEILPPVSVEHRLTLGEGVTPLLELDGLVCKLDYLLPTGSFKDRGAAVLASTALEAGARAAVADSSGNAGSSLAAYFAAAGVPLTVFVPAGSASPKVAQTHSYGAEVVEVEGDRSAASAAARAHVAETGAFYASHAWSPFFIAGMRTVAFELVEQLGPDLPAVVAPAGAGTLLLGLYDGFRLLTERGDLPALPQLIAVQAEACAPLADAFARGLDDVDPGRAWHHSVAGGINIASPPRGREILRAVRESGGAIVAVTEDAIVAARARLLRRGVFAEHTAAAAWAGSTEAPPGAAVVLTGFGLKEAL